MEIFFREVRVIDADLNSTASAAIPLQGVRVIILGSAAASVIAGSILGDLGAEVIRLTPPGADEPLTSRPPLVDDASLSWSIIARSTKSATCALDDVTGLTLFRQLLDHVDVVIESFGPGGLERFGLDPPSFPRSIVLVRISSYGQDGPYSRYPSDDLTALAFSGVSHLTGHRGGSPVPLATSIADHLCAVSVTQAAISALIGRHRTGHGDIIDAPLYGAALRITEWAIPAAHRLGRDRTREGNFPRNAAPLGVYSSNDDQFVAIIGGADANFRRLADAMQDPVISGPRFETPAQRSEQADELNALVSAWAATQSIEEIEAKCLASGVPFGRVYSAADVLADPHFNERRDLVTVNDPAAGAGTQTAPDPQFEGGAVLPPTSPSVLGDDNEYVWCELVGLSLDEFTTHTSTGII
jgi:crotonobetainyl-CoA:carnitine CoA-transferase CaiB-like acyl-CoA transferase